MKRVGVWVAAAGAMASGLLATACGDDSDSTGAGGSGGTGGAAQSSSTTSTTAGPTTSSSASTTSSSSGGGEGGSGGGAECTGDEGPELTECDVVEQDCADPCRPRCIAFIEDPGPTDRTEPACAPLGGDATEDEGCVRPSGNPGEDTCAIGFYCSQIGRPSDATDERTCRPYCLDASDCGAQACILSSEAPTPPQGYCAPPCDPFADACPEGDACTTFTTTEGTNQLVCSSQLGDKQAGEECVGGECAAGLSCEDFGGGLQCRAYCDDEHPCDGAGCNAPPGSSGYGVCAGAAGETILAPFTGLGSGAVRRVDVGGDDSIVMAADFEAGGADLLGPLEALDTANLVVAAMTADGAPLWRGVIGANDGLAGLTNLGLAAAPGGGAALAVSPLGDVTTERGSLPGLGGTDAVLIRFDATGAVVWSRTVGGPGDDRATTATIAGDMVVFAGDLDGTADAGGGVIGLAGEPSTFVAAYALVDGAHLWSRAFGGLPGPLGRAVDDSTLFLQVGAAAGVLDLDGLSIGSPTGPTENLLILDLATGDVTAAAQLVEGNSAENPPALGFGGWAPDTIALAGMFSGDATFGTDTPDSAASTSAYFVQVSAGSVDWLHTVESTAPVYVYGAASSPRGYAAYAGQVSQGGSVLIGDLMLTSPDIGDRRSWIAVHDSPTGALLRAVELTDFDARIGLAFLSDDRVAMGGTKGVSVLDLGL